MSNQSQLANILVDSGLIDQNQFEGYQTRAENQQTNIIEMLIVDGVFSDIDVAQNISMQLGLPLVSLSQLRIPSYIAKLISKEQAEKHKAIPISIKNEGGKEVLYVAFLDPTDSAFIGQIEAKVKKPVVPVVTTLRDLNDAIKRYFRPFRPKKKSGKKAESQSDSVVSKKDIPEVVPEAVEEDFAPQAEENIPEIEAESNETNQEESFFGDENGFEGDSFGNIDLPGDEEIFLDDAPKQEEESADEDDISEIAALTPNFSMDDLDIDLGLDSNNMPIEQAVETEKDTSASKTDVAEDDFAGFDEDFGSGVEDTFDFGEPEIEEESGGKNGFLDFDGSELDKDDSEILKKQQEAEKVHQDAVFSMEDDLFTDEELEEKSPKENEENENHYNQEFSEVDNQSSSQQDTIEDDDFDGFDFDIPEAPEFSVPPSSNSSMQIPTLNAQNEKAEAKSDATIPKEEYTKPAVSEKEMRTVPPEETDWSLDLDELLNDSGQHKTIESGEKISDFEAAAQELDSLLGDTTVPEENTSPEVSDVSLADDLLNKLDSLSINSVSETKDEDLQFLNDFIEGKFDGSNDPGIEKLRSILSSLKKSGSESGQITAPEFMLEILKENFKK